MEIRRGNKLKGVWSSLDWWTILIYAVLLVFGWLSICGASYDFGMEGNFFSLDTRSGMQVVWIASSFGIGFIILMLDDKLYESLAFIIYIFFLVLLFITPFLAKLLHFSKNFLAVTLSKL